jgi:hypothetical protein
MSYSTNRATQGNVKGIQAVQEALDPYKQTNVLLKESMKEALRLKAFVDKTTESEIIRKAIEAVL